MNSSLLQRLRALCEERARTRRQVTYVAAARLLGLADPSSIKTKSLVRRALKVLTRQDHWAGRPFCSSAIVSAAEGIPGRGFFDQAFDYRRLNARRDSYESFARDEFRRFCNSVQNGQTSKGLSFLGHQAAG